MHRSIHPARLPVAAVLALGLLCALLAACTSTDNPGASPTTTPTATPTPTTPSATPSPAPESAIPGAFVEVGDTHYAVLDACQRSPTVGLVTIDLLLADPDGERAAFAYAIEESSPDAPVFPGYSLQLGRDGDPLPGGATAYDHASREGWVLTEGILRDPDAVANTSVRAEFPYPDTACDSVAHHGDADSEDPFVGVWRYAVLDACVADGGSYDLWLSDGARLLLDPTTDGGFAAELRTTEGVTLRSVGSDAVDVTAVDGGVLAGSARVYEDGDPSAPAQRVDIDVSVDEEPCT